MTALQTAVLAAGTSAIAISSGVILWRETSHGAERSFIRSWRDLLGVAVTLGGLAVLLTWLWVAR